MGFPYVGAGGTSGVNVNDVWPASSARLQIMGFRRGSTAIGVDGYTYYLTLATADVPAGTAGYPATGVPANHLYWKREVDLKVASGGPSPQPLAISGAPQSATQNQAYSFTPTTTGGSGTRTYSRSGTLPSGLSFSSTTGAITGTPTVSGTFSGLAITVSDATGSATLSGLSIVVAAASAVVNNPRIGVIGPSTAIQNNAATLGASNTAWTMENLTSGPLIWSLMRDRRAQFLTFVEDTGNNIGGDNQAQFGIGFNEYPAQIAAIKSRFADVARIDRVAYYEFGRNDLSTTTQVDRFKADIQRDVADLKSFGFAKILIAKLWNRNTSVGGEWASGGQARADVVAINSFLDTTYGSDADVALINLPAVMHDPASADANPYVGFTRTDGTHLTSRGASAAGRAISTSLATFAPAQSYPAAPASNAVTPFSGTGGTKTAVTGDVADGWAMTLATDTSSTVVASIATIDGKPYQRALISNTAAVSVTGAVLTLAKSVPIPVAASAKIGLRFRLKVRGLVPWVPFYNLGSTTGGNRGDTTAAITYPLISSTDAGNATPRVTGAGTGFQNTGKMPNDADLDLWVETSAFTLGASGGSNLALSLRTIFGPGAAGDTLQVDIGEIQTFPWPIA